MKILKLGILVVVILAITGAVVFFSESGGEDIDPVVEKTVKKLNDKTDKKWREIRGWSPEMYAECKETIERKHNDKFISQAGETRCINHLNEVALKRTADALDSLYSTPTCTKSLVDSQIAGIRKIAESESFVNDEVVKKQLGIYSEFIAAVSFANKSYSQSTGYSYPSTWNTFSGESFRQQAQRIKRGRYWDVIKNITIVKNGLSEATIDSKIKKARNNFSTTLGRQIVSAFRSRGYSMEGYEQLQGAVRKYEAQGFSNSELRSFFNTYYGNIDFQ